MDIEKTITQIVQGNIIHSRHEFPDYDCFRREKQDVREAIKQELFHRAAELAAKKYGDAIVEERAKGALGDMVYSQISLVIMDENTFRARLREAIENIEIDARRKYGY